MKNLKLFLAAFTLIFAVLVSTANESPSKFKQHLQTLYVDFNCHDDISTLENDKCPTEKKLSKMDISIINAYELLNEEMDELFDFSTIDYLPSDFNQYDEDRHNLATYQLFNKEKDELFDFNTSEFLPSNFDQYNEDVFNLTAYALLNEEKDEIFDFKTKRFLPADFNQYNEDEYIISEHELINEEEDEIFEFNTLDYLPNNLHASE